MSDEPTTCSGSPNISEWTEADWTNCITYMRCWCGRPRECLVIRNEDVTFTELGCSAGHIA